MYLILWLIRLRWKISWLYTWSCDWPIWDERYLDYIPDLVIDPSEMKDILTVYLILWLTHLRWKISWLYTWSCDWPIWDERYLDCISDRCKLWRSLWTTVFYSLLQVQLNIKVQSIFHLKKVYIKRIRIWHKKKKKLWKRANLQFSIYSQLLCLRLRTVQEHLQPPNIYEVVKVQNWNL